LLRRTTMVFSRPCNSWLTAVALTAVLACSTNVLSGVKADDDDYTCPFTCFNALSRTYPCQDLRGSKGTVNRCYTPEGDLTSSGTRKCHDDLYDCRARPAIPDEAMCAGCVIGEGPCRDMAKFEFCRVYDYLKDPPVCPANYIACVDETTTATQTTATATTTTTNTNTTTTTASTTTTTTTTIRQCEYESVAGWGPCVYEIGDEKIIRFLSMPNGECIEGLFNCRETTTSTTTTTTGSTTTTNSLCNEPCATGTFGDCRNAMEEGGGAAECGAPDGSIFDADAVCHSSTLVDCRPHSFASTFPATPFTCDATECEGFSVNGMDVSADGELKFERGSFGHCKHPDTGVCLPYQDDGGCWPGTYSCAEEKTCAEAAKKKTCCGCVSTEMGQTSGACKHPTTGICLGFIKNTKECFPGTEAC